MSTLELLANVLEYIEQHITEDIHTDDIAKACFCSRSSLEKIFRFANHISVRDYIIRRRMTRAGATLVMCPDMSILDVAVMYGYSSNEAFTRAFRQVWNQLPSEHRARKRPTELYPRLDTPRESGDDLMNNIRKFDIRNLYDIFQQRRDCWFICADIKHLIPINEISRKAGDLAIVESMARLDAVAEEDDIVFRIGGDEFVILTASPDEAAAREKQDMILLHNGECITFEGRDIPLSLYVCTLKLDKKTERYGELFTALWKAVAEVK